MTILMITAGRKQEGSWGARVRNRRRVLSLWSQCRPATRVIIFIIIIWSLWWWWWSSLWSRYRPTLDKVRSLFLSFDNRQYWWEPLMGTFRDPLRSLSPTFYHVLDYQNDHQYSIHHKKFPTNCKGMMPVWELGPIEWVCVRINQRAKTSRTSMMTRTWSFWWRGHDHFDEEVRIICRIYQIAETLPVLFCWQSLVFQRCCCCYIFLGDSGHCNKNYVWS